MKKYELIFFVIFLWYDLFILWKAFQRKNIRRECIQGMKYEEIAERYTDVVYRAALNYCKNKNDAEDAVQNAFMKMLQSKVEFQDEEHI